MFKAPPTGKMAGTFATLWPLWSGMAGVHWVEGESVDAISQEVNAIREGDLFRHNVFADEKDLIWVRR